MVLRLNIEASEVFESICSMLISAFILSWPLYLILLLQRSTFHSGLLVFAYSVLHFRTKEGMSISFSYQEGKHLSHQNCRGSLVFKNVIIKISESSPTILKFAIVIVKCFSNSFVLYRPCLSHFIFTEEHIYPIKTTRGWFVFTNALVILS